MFLRIATTLCTKMRVLIFSDLQADEGSDRLRADPSIPMQRWRVNKFYDWASSVAASNGCSAVWDLGDTTNNRSTLSHHTIHSVIRGSKTLTSGRPAVFNLKLVGNHEQHLRAKEVHVGGVFSPYFKVVEDREIIHFPDFSVVCASFGYDDDLARWLEASIDVVKSEHKKVIVLGHFMVAGSRMGSGISSSIGTVPKEALAKADLVLLGHVHRRQRVGANGWYIGSPFQQDFGESSDPTKAVAILDTDTLQLEWVASPFPVYRTITVDELAQAAETNDVLKVIIRTNDEAERFYTSPSAGTVEPVYAFSHKESTQEVSNLESSFDTMTKAYASSVELPGVSADELLKEVRELQYAE